MASSYKTRITAAAVFAIAFAFVESAVVIYLRAIYYPGGFAFPLRMMSTHHLVVEIARELSTMVMLVSVGILAGRCRWQKLGYFLVTFGIWDIFYYVWLKVLLDWPSALFDLDILFLIPTPWIGPVIAPLIISFFMVATGIVMIKKVEHNENFRPTLLSRGLGIFATAFILFSFMNDTDATIRLHTPRPYRYELFAAGMICYCASFISTLRTKRIEGIR